MSDLSDRLSALGDFTSPAPWFDDYGKIGSGEDGIGEMDEAHDAAFIVAARNLWQPMLAFIEAAERIIPALDANEPVSERDRASLNNAYNELGRAAEQTP